ncbi:S8 family serine peptidase [Ideonella paludis]|uniref:S8 family serine peptidase n=1 Tax=Ideonella paludis TaxID=1233411 RepID=A0ABS5DTS0_9BURK|nr:S8 family serine peptidase [Ideonella paludis]MBQ0934531.1 S8 family serine peptidase [Ideonella paludis]
MSTSFALTLRLTAAAAAVSTLLAACGGGDDAPPAAVTTGTCIDGTTANAVGADDPFAAHAWHLLNTGATQAVSAQSNAGVAGIDANVSDIHKAGKGCTGKGVKIAVVDTAMELGHEDLQPNVLPGQSFSFATLSSDTSPAADQVDLDHGTGVAGVAAARGWNGLGSRGTAPFASLLAFPTVDVKLHESLSSDAVAYLSFGASELAGQGPAVTLFANRSSGVDVFNYSAGMDIGVPAPVESPGAQESAMAFGVKTRREGKGAIYLQAAGNEYQGSEKFFMPDGSTAEIFCQTALSAAQLPGSFANLDAVSCGSPNQDYRGHESKYMIAAMHNTGRAASYSSAGSSVWVAGFGGEFGGDQAAIITTDNSGCASGANNVANAAKWKASFPDWTKIIADLFGASTQDPNCHYTGRMNGTSAATPSVSGIVALMLEANPKLTWRDVGYILARSARQVDPTIADSSRQPRYLPQGNAVGWPLDLPWQTNAAGYRFQNRYGFGMADARAAVNMSIGFTAPKGRREATLVAPLSGPSTTSTIDGFTVYSGLARFADTTAVQGKLQLDVTLTNVSGAPLNVGGLQFEVINRRSGTRSIVMPAFTAWYIGGQRDDALLMNGASQSLRFFSNAFFGESLSGDFEVRVVDVRGQSKGLNFTANLSSHSL